jgi:hypothetical protein
MNSCSRSRPYASATVEGSLKSVATGGNSLCTSPSTAHLPQTLMATKPRSTKPSTKETRSDPAVSYNEFKEYEGQRYTGMKIGRSHKWYYDQGEWKETKITPDLWQISYAVTKRRAGRAPEGSGVPVGTAYHWYVLAHQNVAKLNANDYTTSLTGLKFKIAHQRADTGKWSATPRTQRKRMIMFLRGVLADLERAGAGMASDAPPRVRGRKVAKARGARPAARRTSTRRRNHGQSQSQLS